MILSKGKTGQGRRQADRPTRNTRQDANGIAGTGKTEQIAPSPRAPEALRQKESARQQRTTERNPHNESVLYDGKQIQYSTLSTKSKGASYEKVQP